MGDGSGHRASALKFSAGRLRCWRQLQRCDWQPSLPCIDEAFVFVFGSPSRLVSCVCTQECMELLTDFQRVHVPKDEFSKRALTRGRAFSMEGYVFNVNVQVERSGDGKENLSDLLLLSGKCFASYRKRKKHTMELRMKGGPTFKLLKGSCSCEAGEGERCSMSVDLSFGFYASLLFLEMNERLVAKDRRLLLGDSGVFPNGTSLLTNRCRDSTSRKFKKVSHFVSWQTSHPS